VGEIQEAVYHIMMWEKPNQIGFHFPLNGIVDGKGYQIKLLLRFRNKRSINDKLIGLDLEGIIKTIGTY